MASTEPVDTLDVIEGRLPFYTHDGDLGTDPIPDGWDRAGVDATDGRALYTYAGDTRGQGPIGDQTGDGWSVYEGNVQARVDVVNADADIAPA